jgi:hypothetical protein
MHHRLVLMRSATGWTTADSETGWTTTDSNKLVSIINADFQKILGRNVKG